MAARPASMLLVAILAHVLGVGRAGVCQSPPVWQAMRINVPDDQIDLLANSDEYQLVNIAKLDSLLRTESARRRAAQNSVAGIADAIYVAEMSERAIVSKHSRWRFRDLNERQPMEVGFPNVAVRPADATLTSLTDFISFQPDGQAMVLADRELNEAWFGFIAKPFKSDVQSTHFRIRFPASLMGKLLISVPKNLQLDSSSVPVSIVDHPDSQMPGDWPDEYKITSSDLVDWYVLLISGREQLDLVLTPRREHSVSHWDMIAKSCRKDFNVRQSEIFLGTEFLIAGQGASDLNFNIDSRLKIRGIYVDKQEVMWSRHRDAVDENLIKVKLPESSTGIHQIKLDAFMPVSFPFEGSLPSIQIDRGYVLDGLSTLTGGETTLVEHLRPAGVRATMSWVPTATGQARELPGWRWEWQGAMPASHVRIVPRHSPWQLRSLTKFSVHPTWVAATTQLQLSGRDLRSNQLELDIGRGWFVDDTSCTLNNASVSTELLQLAGGHNKLVVRWGDVRNSATLDLSISAHVPRAANAEQIKLPQSALIALDGADQQDTYVVETTGQYQLQVGLELLQLRQTEDDLAPWQKNLLPRLAETWIFRGVRGSLPPLTMRRIRGSFTSKHAANISMRQDQLDIEYRMSCLPISGSVARLQVVVPTAIEWAPQAWSLDSLGGKPATGVYVTTAIIGSSPTETTMELSFSKPLGQAFTLLSSIKQPLHNERRIIPLTTTPEAANQEGLLRLPRELWQSITSTPFDILPPGLDSEADDESDLLDKRASDIVQCRYDPNGLSKIEIDAKPNLPLGWIWTQETDHWYLGAEPTRHEVRWKIMSPNYGILKIKYPQAWKPIQLMIDGTTQFLPQNTVAGTLSIALPAGDQVELTLVCTGSSQTQPWLGRLVKEQVEVSMDVLHREHRHWIAPGKVTVASWLKSDSTGWLRRLSPLQWWERLRPESSEVATRPLYASEHSTAGRNKSAASKSHEKDGDMRERAGWIVAATLQPGNHDQQIGWLSKTHSELNWWVVDRAAATIVAVAIISILALLFYRLCKYRAGHWLSVATMLTMSCLLAPPEVVSLIQLGCLAYSVALFVCIAHGIVSLQWSRKATARRGSTVGRQIPMSIGTVLVLAVLGSSLPAQEDNPLKRSSRKIYGILVPTDQQQTPSGNLVYAPKQLLQLLENPLQGALRGSTSRINSVTYRVQLQPSLLRSATNEITVDLDVTLSSNEPQLRFPVRLSEVQLARAYVDGIEVFGTEFRQESENIVWNAPDAKRYKVQIVLVPRGSVQELDGRGRLSLSIPPIPTARAEVRAESTREIDVNCIGDTVRDGRDTMYVELGPVSKLDISWPLRGTTDVVPQVFAHTWIRIRQSQVVAYGQLHITGASALPEKLFLSCDPEWIPVGTQWQDASLLPAEILPGSPRSVYAIRRQRIGSDNATTVRILLLPRDPDSAQTLPIPFLSIQESETISRTLSVSVPGFPGWNLDGTETLSSFPQPFSVWGDAKLAEQAVTWRVPLRNVKATLVRQASPGPPAVEETTEIHLRQPETAIRYEAAWKTPVEGQSTFALRIPAAARVVSVRINQLPASYNISQATSEARLTLMHDNARGGVQSFNVELALPNRFDAEQQLARPVLDDWQIASSLIRLSRGTELDCTVIRHAEKGLELVPTSSSSKDLLTDLEQSLGEVQLDGQLRDSVYLPLSAKLSRRTESSECNSVLRMVHADGGWIGEFESQVVTPNASLDYFFVDMPIEFRDSYQTQTMSMTLPSAESNRVTLCIVPPAPVNGVTRIQVSLKLPNAFSHQSIRIPDLRAFWSVRNRPLIALPNELDGQAVRWSNTGRKLIASKKHQWFDATGYTLFQHNESQQQVNWQSVAMPGQAAKIHHALAEIQFIDRNACVGNIDYWIEPRGQATLVAKVPNHLQIVGAMIGLQAANWSRSNTDEVNVLLQPNDLPTRLRLLLRWDLPHIDTELQPNTFPLPFPKLLANAQECRLMVVTRMQKARFRPKLQGPWQSISPSEVHEEVENRWRAMLNYSVANATLHSPQEILPWLAMWQPVAREMSSAAKKNSELPASEESTGDGDRSTSLVSADEFWQAYIEKLGVEQALISSNTIRLHMDADAEITWAAICTSPSDETACYLENETIEDTYKLAWYLPVLIAFSGLVGLVLGRRVEPVLGWLIADQTWVLIATLSILLWLLLPIVWPSWFTALLAAYSLGYRLVSRSWRGRVDFVSY